MLEFFGDAIIALLSRFETVLFNKGFSENELDLERLKRESNMKFKEINDQFSLSNYMICDTDAFLPPLFNKPNFENILNFKKNEMNNKQLLNRCIMESYKR